MTVAGLHSESLLSQLHAAPGELVVAVTGGGSQAIADLLTTAGASRTVLEARVPYAPEALVDWLRATPEQFCSARTARAMAMAGWFRARQLTAHRQIAAPPLAGIGCTASLASDRPKRGAHRLYVALQTLEATICWSLELEHDLRDRAAEERIAAQLVMRAVAEFKGLPDLAPELELSPRETLVTRVVTAPTSWQQLLNNGAGATPARADTERGALPLAVMPGAFNPLHDGHQAMWSHAERRLGVPVVAEISITNVDKPALDYQEMHDRAEQFVASRTLWFSAAPTFAEKAERFPGATFVVGADTMVRIGLPRYYGDSAAARDRAIDAIASRGCRFLVFGRLVGDRFETLDDLQLAPPLRALCSGVSEAEFRRDISSTELRGSRRTDA